MGASRLAQALAIFAVIGAGFVLWLEGRAARADELSGDDKLRLLYSHRFTFGRDGLPLLTVEIMSGQERVVASAKGGLTVEPEGEGGAEIAAGDSWVITAERATPAKVRYWTVVSRAADETELATWTQRGYQPKVLEIGVVFGVEGEMIDSRESLVGIAPEDTPEAAARAAKALASKWKVETSVAPELVERARGVIVAKNSETGATVKNEGILWFRPGNSAVVTIHDVVHGGGGSQVGAEKRQTRSYFGRVFVTLGRDGRLTVVNAIPEDRLLMGLVPAEIFPDAPAEALRAQAVAARTELLAKIGTRHFEDPFLLCSSQHCQVYGGVGLEDERTSAAVKGTRGQVLMRDGGGLVQAYYSASCGGFSESNENVWGLPPDPTLRGKLDAQGAGKKALGAFAQGVTDQNIDAFLAAPAEHAFCGATRYAKGRYRWSVVVAAADLDALVAKELPSLGRVTELLPAARGVSGRVRSLEIVGDHGRATVEGDLRIRRLFGGLKSALFVVRAEAKGGRPVRWTFTGAGFGHGVGMCQTGAIGLAESGAAADKILRHYYPSSHVHRLY
jgi:SpoIID/LytB domain protein